MTKIYQTGTSVGTWRKLAFMSVLGLATSVSYGQEQGRPIVGKNMQLSRSMKPGTAKRTNALPYPASRGQNVAGTYTDLGTTGTAIATANLDDANSGVQDIGFKFSYNGVDFTKFVLNTNGFIKLGEVAPVDPEDTDILVNSTDQNVIAPASGIDLAGAVNQTTSPTEYRVFTSNDPVGSRVCTIQFKNLSDQLPGNTTAQFATMQFQIKLYESSNMVEFVYGAWTSSGNTALGKGFLVGLKGSSEAPTDLSLAYKASSSTAWTTTVFQTVVGTNYAPHFVRNTFLPDPGRTYRFRTQAATDAGVTTIYTMGKLAVPNSLPHVVSAVVTNNGSAPLTSLPVTLTVGGANTFVNVKTVASLAVGASQTVTFDAYPTPLVLGTNTVTVSVPADGDNTNNSLPYTQEITADQVAYINASQALVAGGITLTDAQSAPLPGGSLAVKYKNSQPVAITQVKAGFPAGTAATFQVLVLNSDGANGTPGTILYSSPVQNRPATAGTVTVLVPSIVVQGDFHVAVKQVTGGIALGYQNELPLRANTFFVQFEPGPTWSSLSTFAGAPYRLALDAVLSPVPTCITPTSLAISKVGITTATVSFNGPANATGYTVIYGAKGFDPATGGTSVTTTASPYALTGLAASTEYDVYVRANCGATDKSFLAGPVQFKTDCQPPVISTFPYAENFDSVLPGAIPCGLIVSDDNADGKTWMVVGNDGAGRFPASAPNQMRYAFSSTVAANDWFYTNPLALKAGTSYLVSFKYRGAQPSSTEKLEVKYGTATTAAAQTNLLWKNEAITNADYVTATGGTAVGQVTPITPTADGNYYVGFHVFSAANQFNLYIDDVTVTTAVVNSSSSALARAINLYPNPTAGNLTVEVRGANAKGGLQVEVTNMLGQRVHTATVRGNGTSQVDLSTLANGMYTVKVRNGSEYMVSRIAIQK
ncbi:T9SS type A sorting domain-containing protein [Hymenobacter rubripertinctus]|uniref:T9SS C-terminal target domain-containing protein n=1 Tax=Hymenobacter rubripertinctus TaxID=2029981 RepID=A0A418R1I5_9BACT|nr:T9SS type A sorting domain-containing protein [Hymenobacter rubripertinctus]RIY11297.1 T9SS C-terminal target domain-containing protein [Hymenobacter rubripertinctus]